MATTGYTTTLTVTDVAYVAVTAHIVCSSIAIKEDPSVASWPTVAFNIKKGAGTAIQCPIGTGYAFTKGSNQGSSQQYFPNEIAGYVILPSVGSTTFQQDET